MELHRCPYLDLPLTKKRPLNGTFTIYSIMKALTIFLAGFMISMVPQEPSINKVDWILGTWANPSNNEKRQAFEIWEKVSDTKYKGIGFTLKGGDTTFVERLEIIEKEGNLFYVADVAHNKAPVFFKFTTISDTLFICENPVHDFPKEIAYRRDGDNLYAHVSDGKRKIDFGFKRVIE